MISGPEEVIHVLDGEEQKVCSPKNNAINDATYYATGKVIYPSAIKTQMREYCEEEMWVWVFPHHKCQKKFVKSRVQDEWFDEFLAWVMWKKPYSQFQSHSIHIVKNYNYADLTFKKKLSNRC